MKIYQIKTSFVISILLFVENCLLYDTIHECSVRLRTGPNPVEINRFRSHTENVLINASTLN